MFLRCLGVFNASRSLIQQFRTLNPSLLHKNDRVSYYVKLCIQYYGRSSGMLAYMLHMVYVYGSMVVEELK